eukprot:2455952-Lingulodinium_polyedra.AAC.1
MAASGRDPWADGLHALAVEMTPFRCQQQTDRKRHRNAHYGSPQPNVGAPAATHETLYTPPLARATMSLL